MTVRELLQQVRDTLQDTDRVYWSESELINLYNDAKRLIASERVEDKTTTSLLLSADTNTYSIDNVLRYISAKDSNDISRQLYPDDDSGDGDTYGIIIKAYNSVYVNSPEDDVTVTFKVVSMPSEDNLNDTVRTGDENSIKYYILSRAYEKENEMENFQKAQYFFAKYQTEFKSAKKNANVGYRADTRTTKAYYY